MKALALILTFSIITAFSHATPTLVTQPQINHSPILYYAQENVNKLHILSSSFLFLKYKPKIGIPYYSKYL